MSFQTLTIRVFPIILFFMATNPWQKAFAQRMVIASENGTTNSPTSSSSSDQSQILKTYPDGTKKIVPLAALNFHDDGKAFGGSPQLSVYSDPATPIIPPSSERLSVAPIGTPVTPTTMNNSLPSSPDPLAGTTSTTAAGDPMGGGPTANPMGGGSAPVDPLSGISPKGSPPPLQTVSGKPAPVSSAETTVELGTYEDFFMNAAIGGSIQGQLTARRVYNGSNMQAYPYTYTSGILGGQSVSAENFTFNPGFRFDVEFGYNIYDWLGVSLQTGVVYNGLNQYNVTLSNGESYHNSADGELVQVPVQIDGILRWPGTTAFKPFIGGGVGAIWQQLDVNNYYISTSDVQGNYCRSAFQFGFNGQVGANYTVTPGVDFYGVFKLLGAFTPRIGNYDFENSYNFALEVGVQSRF
jgi:opacity protein-like surface antigen